MIVEQRIGGHGELLPTRGFSRWRLPALGDARTAWRTHDGLYAVSSLEQSHLPGSGEPPLTGPQWLISVSRPPVDDGTRCTVTAADLERVVDCFAMPAFDEDNHHPGIARHLWCPVDPQYRDACECKATELTIVDGDYVWTTEADTCRGCEYQRMFGYPCPRHS